METIKRGINNPLASWIGGVGLGAVITTSMVLGGYKNSFDSLKDDVKITKVAVEQIKIDVAVLKTKQEAFYR